MSPTFTRWIRFSISRPSGTGSHPTSRLIVPPTAPMPGCRAFGAGSRLMRSRYTIPIVASLTLAIGAVGAIGAGSFYSAADEALPSVRQYGYGENPGNDLDLYLPAAVAAA